MSGIALRLGQRIQDFNRAAFSLARRRGLPGTIRHGGLAFAYVFLTAALDPHPPAALLARKPVLDVLHRAVEYLVGVLTDPPEIDGDVGAERGDGQARITVIELNLSRVIGSSADAVAHPH